MVGLSFLGLAACSSDGTWLVVEVKSALEADGTPQLSIPDEVDRLAFRVEGLTTGASFS